MDEGTTKLLFGIGMSVFSGGVSWGTAHQKTKALTAEVAALRTTISTMEKENKARDEKMQNDIKVRDEKMQNENKNRDKDLSDFKLAVSVTLGRVDENIKSFKDDFRLIMEKLDKITK